MFLYVWQLVIVSLPARHHQSRQTFEKANISFFLQVVQHFLHQDKSTVNRELMLWTNSACWLMRTCWTSMFPPLRMEMPSLRVKVTIAPSRPDDHKSYITQSLHYRWGIHKGRHVNRLPTFAGTDHLKHHLCSTSIMQSRLLVQHLLLLHFLFLCKNR